MASLRLLHAGAVLLAALAIVAVITLESRNASGQVVLSEDKALALAEGKISDAEQKRIAEGGMSPAVTKMTLKKRDQLRKLVKDAEQKEAMVTLQAWKLQQAQDALHSQLQQRPTKIRRMLGANGGRAAAMNGGDAMVSVNKIRRDDAAEPAPIIRRDAEVMTQTSSRPWHTAVG